MDPNNPVVKLCVAGIQAEAQGHLEEARQLFLQAWESRQDDFEACIAAHYVARHQDDPHETLRWNQLALAHAEASAPTEVEGFFPSLYLNLGWSYEMLGQAAEACRYYELALNRLEAGQQNAVGQGAGPDGAYQAVVAQGIAEGRRRMGCESL